MAQLAEVLTEQERLDAFDLGVSVASCQARAWRGVNSELRLHTEQHAQADARLLALEKHCAALQAALDAGLTETHESIRKVGIKAADAAETTEKAETQRRKFEQKAREMEAETVAAAEKLQVLEKRCEKLQAALEAEQVARQRLEGRLKEELAEGGRANESAALRLSTELNALKEAHRARLEHTESNFTKLDATVETSVLSPLKALERRLLVLETELDAAHKSATHTDHKLADLGRAIRQTEVDIQSNQQAGEVLVEKVRVCQQWQAESFTSTQMRLTAHEKEVAAALDRAAELVKEVEGYNFKLTMFTKEMEAKVANAVSDVSARGNATTQQMDALDKKLLAALEAERGARVHMERYLINLRLHQGPAGSGEGNGGGTVPEYKPNKPSSAAWQSALGDAVTVNQGPPTPSMVNSADDAPPDLGGNTGELMELPLEVDKATGTEERAALDAACEAAMSDRALGSMTAGLDTSTMDTSIAALAHQQASEQEALLRWEEAREQRKWEDRARALAAARPDGPLPIPPVPDTVGKQASGPPLLLPTVASAAAVPMAAADPAAAGATAAHAGAEQTKDLVKQTFSSISF